MKICPSCKFENDDNILKCQKCGVELVNDFFEKSDFSENNILNIVDKSPIVTEDGKKASFYSLKKGSKFKEYFIERVINKSFIGNNYLITDGKNNYVLKLFYESVYQNEVMFSNSITKYIEVQEKQQYQILKYGKESDYYFVITSFIEGRTLTEIMESKKERNETFRFKQAYGLIAQIANQLVSIPSYFHTFITPNSIIITKDALVVLTDFAIYNSLTPSNRFRASVKKGFTDFIAPELNKQTPDKYNFADVYSLGILLYWLLTSRTPQEDFRLPKTPNDDISQSLWYFLENSFAPEPNKRYSDIKEFLHSLNMLIEEKPMPVVKKFESTEEEPEADDIELTEDFNDANMPPQLKSEPPQLKKPPQFVPQSIKTKKLSLPNKKPVDEFDNLQVKKGDVTLGELDDVERWFFVKNGVDFGPVSAKKVRELVELGELTPETVIKTLTHPVQKGEIKSFELFQNFLKDFSIKQGEKELEIAIKRSKRNKTIGILGFIAALIAIGVGIFIFNSQEEKKKYTHKSLEEMKEKKVEVTVTGDENIVEEDVKEDETKQEENKDGTKKKTTKKKRYRTKKVIKDGKEVVIKEEINEEEEMKKSFALNKKENTDTADISFSGNGEGDDLTKEEILKTINKFKSQIIKCFEDEYEKSGYLPPELNILYNIRTDGKIYNVVINHPKYKKEEGTLNYCVLKVFQQISFPAFKGGTKSGSFPLQFQLE